MSALLYILTLCCGTAPLTRAQDAELPCWFGWSRRDTNCSSASSSTSMQAKRASTATISSYRSLPACKIGVHALCTTTNRVPTGADQPSSAPVPISKTKGRPGHAMVASWPLKQDKRPRCPGGGGLDQQKSLGYRRNPIRYHGFMEMLRRPSTPVMSIPRADDFCVFLLLSLVLSNAIRWGLRRGSESISFLTMRSLLMYALVGLICACLSLGRLGLLHATSTSSITQR